MAIEINYGDANPFAASVVKARQAIPHEENTNLELVAFDRGYTPKPNDVVARYKLSVPGIQEGQQTMAIRVSDVQDGDLEKRLTSFYEGVHCLARLCAIARDRVVTITYPA